MPDITHDGELLAYMLRASDISEPALDISEPDLDMLAYDIADTMDRGEYGLGDITQDDIRALLPAFLVACLAHADANEITSRSCPDGGTCHHECGTGGCFRVGSCGPLSGIYLGDTWPESVRQAES